MNTTALLKQLHRERLQAINQTRYVSVRQCSAFVRRAYRDLQRANKLHNRADRELRDAGYIAHGHVGRLQVTADATKHRAALAAAHQAATLGLLKATSGPARAKVIEQFIADTKELLS